MKIEIEISEQDLHDAVKEKMAAEIVYDLVGFGTDRKENVKKILSKINWANSSKELQETIIKKFFENIISKEFR